jgi:hypothetical protein
VARTLLTVASLLALIYAGLCDLLYWQQRSLIYFPQATGSDAAHTDIALERPGAVLRGWIVNPGQTNALVYFGGNAERIELARDSFRRWLPDTTVYLVAYRGYGASDGSPAEKPILADALAVFDQASARHHGGQVAVAGRSLGSGVASYVASQRTVRQLILITPFDSLADVAQTHYPVFPVRWLLRDRYESFRYLPGHQGQLLVMRAGRDSVIPARHTDRLLATFSGRAQVIDFPEDDHDSLSARARYWSALQAFLLPAGTDDATAKEPQAP